MYKGRKKPYKKTRVQRIYLLCILLLMLYLLFNYFKKDKTYDTGMYSEKAIQSSTKSLDILSKDEIIFETVTEQSTVKQEYDETIELYNMEKLLNPDYLKSTYYIVDQRTSFIEEMFNVEVFMNKKFSIETNTEQPKILIFHTHSQEAFCDSNGEESETIYGMGELLAKTLSEVYGIAVMHDDGKYDYVNGSVQILGAYERMEPKIKKILEEYPSIEMVIDLHRDGVDENIHLVTEINGKPTAKIMFVNGLCKYWSNGKLADGAYNPFLEDNLALSFQMQLKAGEIYPGFTRKIYLNAYRYSLHMKPMSMLIELGAQTNTVEEAKNAIAPLAKVIAEVITK